MCRPGSTACWPRSTNAFPPRSKNACVSPRTPRRRQRPAHQNELLTHCPIRRVVQTDVTAAFEGDPAARSVEEIILAYPCVLVISLQRIAHVLYHLGVPLLPRMLTEYGHERTGVTSIPARTSARIFSSTTAPASSSARPRRSAPREALPGRHARREIVRGRRRGQPGQGRETPSRHRRPRHDLRPRHDPRRRHPHRRAFRHRRQRLAARLHPRRTASPTTRQTSLVVRQRPRRRGHHGNPGDAPIWAI